VKPLVYVTGAGGYIGTPLVQKLLQDRNYNVLMTFDDINETKDDGVKADIVVHLAAKLPSSDCLTEDIMSTNLDATKLIAELKCKPNAHFILLSTDYVFKSDGEPKHEHSPYSPETIYGESKTLAEQYILNKKCLNGAVLRTSMIYGYDHPKRTNFFKFLHAKVSNNKKVGLFTDVFSRPTHITDLINFIVKTIDDKIVGIVHACGETYINRYDLGTAFCKANGFDTSLLQPAMMPEDGRWPTALNLNPSQAFLKNIKMPLEQGIVNCLERL